MATAPHFPAALYAKQEAVPGTYGAPALTDLVPVASETGARFRFHGDPIERRSMRPHMDGIPTLPPPNWYWQIDVETEMHPGSAIDTAGPYGRFLNACGCEEVLSPAVSATHRLSANPLAAAGDESLSFLKELSTGGNYFTAAGWRGSFEISFDGNSPVLLKCSGIAKYVAPVKLVTPLVPVEFTTLPYVVLGDASPALIGAYSMQLRSGRIIGPYESLARPNRAAGAANGYHTWPAAIRRRGNTQVELTFEAESETEYAAYTKCLAGTAEDLVLIFKSGTRTLTATINDVRLAGPEQSDECPVLFTIRGYATGTGGTGASIVLVQT